MEQLVFPFLEWELAIPLEPQPYYGSSFFGGKDWHFWTGGGSTSVAASPTKSYENKGTYYHACPFKVGRPAGGGVIEKIRLFQGYSETWYWILSLAPVGDCVDLLNDWEALGAISRREWYHYEGNYWLNEEIHVRSRDAIVDKEETPSKIPHLTLEYDVEGEVVGAKLDLFREYSDEEFEELRRWVPSRAFDLIDSAYQECMC
jgi:hypothetical protein